MCHCWKFRSEESSLDFIFLHKITSNDHPDYNFAIGIDQLRTGLAIDIQDHTQVTDGHTRFNVQ